MESELRKGREAVVREHMESENRQEFDVTMGTFSHPRYEIVATGDVHDGAAEVAAYFDETRTAFPDQRNELIALHHADDAVIAEFDLKGTHLGPFRGLPPTGRAFACRMTAFFLFEEDRLVCERVYFDSATILRQLGIAHDPLTLRGRIAILLNHPLTIGRAVVRQAGRRRSPETTKARRSGPSSQKRFSALDRLYVDGLRALVARLGLVRDLRALGERLVAVADDAGVVDEEILPALVGRDEAEALLVAEPLHGSGCHGFLHLLMCQHAEDAFSNDSSACTSYPEPCGPANGTDASTPCGRSQASPPPAFRVAAP
jgi:steroid delta-isomerase-like uncharacterized protein